MKAFYFVMDVGGTELKVNCIGQDGVPLFETYLNYPAIAQGSKVEIVENFKEIFSTVTQKFLKKNGQLIGIGMAFPGPFDYERGISQIQNLRKYEEIYGVNLKTYFQEWTKELIGEEVPIIFLNDATSFGVGEYFKDETKNNHKGIYLTLGTGCGSTFIENQQIVKGKYGLNDEGALYNKPFRDGIIDQYLSSQGLSKLAENDGFKGINGYELSKLAREGNTTAKVIFDKFGQLIGQALSPYIHTFQPDEIVLGGQISKSFDLFEAGLLTEISDLPVSTCIIRKSQDSTKATFQGLVQQLKNRTGDK